MLLDQVKKIFKSERQLVPMPPISEAELTDFKKWALSIADLTQCKSAIITGSISRNQTHPYSDIDIEMYTDRDFGYQAFDIWNGRLVALHVEPKNEMEEEVKNPYYQVWHHATLRDGLVIKDDDGFIKKITKIADGNYRFGGLNEAFERLEQEKKIDEYHALTAFDNGDVLKGLYHLSYYIQHSSIYSSLRGRQSLSSEIKLTEKFSKVTSASSSHTADFCDSLKDYFSQKNISHALSLSNQVDTLRDPSAITWEDTKIALRRVLEYRRKIYGSLDRNDPAANLFRLYCLGRVAGSYFIFNKVASNFSSSSRLLNETAILACATEDLLSNPINGSRKASDTIMENICDLLAEASDIKIDGYKNYIHDIHSLEF